MKLNGRRRHSTYVWILTLIVGKEILHDVFTVDNQSLSDWYGSVPILFRFCQNLLCCCCRVCMLLYISEFVKFGVWSNDVDTYRIIWTLQVIGSMYGNHIYFCKPRYVFICLRVEVQMCLPQQWWYQILATKYVQPSPELLFQFTFNARCVISKRLPNYLKRYMYHNWSITMIYSLLFAQVVIWFFTAYVETFSRTGDVAFNRRPWEIMQVVKRSRLVKSILPITLNLSHWYKMPNAHRISCYKILQNIFHLIWNAK